MLSFQGVFSYSGMGGMGEKHPSTDFSSAKSDGESLINRYIYIFIYI